VFAHFLIEAAAEVLPEGLINDERPNEVMSLCKEVSIRSFDTIFSGQMGLKVSALKISEISIGKEDLIVDQTGGTEISGLNLSQYQSARFSTM
jgi:hypothetical protein